MYGCVTVPLECGCVGVCCSAKLWMYMHHCTCGYVAVQLKSGYVRMCCSWAKIWIIIMLEIHHSGREPSICKYVNVLQFTQDLELDVNASCMHGCEAVQLESACVAVQPRARSVCIIASMTVVVSLKSGYMFGGVADPLLFEYMHVWLCGTSAKVWLCLYVLQFSSSLAMFAYVAVQLKSGYVCICCSSAKVWLCLHVWQFSSSLAMFAYVAVQLKSGYVCICCSSAKVWLCLHVWQFSSSLAMFACEAVQLKSGYISICCSSATVWLCLHVWQFS